MRNTGGGRIPSTNPIEGNIVLYIKDVHRNGHPESRSAIISYCTFRFKKFKEMTYNAKHKWVKSFIDRHQLSDRVIQHSGSQLQKELSIKRLRWSKIISQYIKEKKYSPEHVWNMDQTGVIYDMKPKKVIVPKGTTKVSDLNLEVTQKSFRVTTYLTINAAGGKAKPFIVLPGTPNGTIECSEMCNYKGDAKYTVQANGWTDEHVMLSYMHQILTEIRIPNVTQLLLLDALSTHQTKSVQLKLQEIGFEVIYVEAGTTSVCQPLDVGIMGPFKATLRSKAEYILHERYWSDVLNRFFKKNCKEELPEWVNKGLDIECETIPITELLAEIPSTTKDWNTAKARRAKIVQRISETWAEIESQTVSESFRSAGVLFSDQERIDFEKKYDYHHMKCNEVVEDILNQIINEIEDANIYESLYKNRRSGTFKVNKRATTKIKLEKDSGDIYQKATRKKQKKSHCSIEYASYRKVDTMCTIKVEKSDILCLNPNTCLNDCVLSYLIHRYIPRAQNMLTFDCQFFANMKLYQGLHGKDYNGYKLFCGLTDTLDWKMLKFVQLPVNMNNHWSFCLLENPMEVDGGSKVYIIDSLIGIHNIHEIADAVMNYIFHEMTAKYSKKHSEKYSTKLISTDPQQSDCFDCGVYLFAYMSEIAKYILDENCNAIENAIFSLTKGFDTKKSLKLRFSIKKYVAK